jgi:hypothetical protein
LLSFCVKKGMDRQDVKGFLNITDSFDNVDWNHFCEQYYLFICHCHHEMGKSLSLDPKKL